LLQADKAAIGKPKTSGGKSSVKAQLAAPSPPRKKALVTPPQSELSMEFPVPIDDDDDDGFSVPPPSDKAVGMDTDGGDDEFIPLKED
jgi:hypothetical protein